VSTEYVDLADYLAIVAEVTGLDIEVVMKTTDLGLADSALHAPSAGFGERDFYPDFIDKAAVLAVRLVRTIRCPMATSGRRGSRCACSSSSTVGRGIRSPRSRMPSGQCWRSRRESGTKTHWRAGCGTT
jgi:hypothetical protein